MDNSLQLLGGFMKLQKLGGYAAIGTICAYLAAVGVVLIKIGFDIIDLLSCIACVWNGIALLGQKPPELAAHLMHCRMLGKP
jgi:hypothetical protein